MPKLTDAQKANQFMIDLQRPDASGHTEMMGYMIDASSYRLPTKRRLYALERLATLSNEYAAWASRYKSQIISDAEQN